MNDKPLLRLAMSIAYNATIAGRDISERDYTAICELANINGEVISREEIDAHIESGKEVGEVARKRAQSTKKADKDGELFWLPREPIPDMPPTPLMPHDIIPPVLAPYIVDVATRSCIPVEMVAIPAMVSLSSLVGTHGRVRPDRHTRWTTPPNLWGVIVGRPGMKKSNALKAGVFVVEKLAAEALDESAAQRKAVIGQKISLESKLKHMKSGKNPDPYEIESIVEDLKALEVADRRYMTSDTTIEKLGVMISENPRGILLVRDELGGWLMSMTKAGRETDREFYNESWSGDSSFTTDRMSRETVNIKGICVSVIGGIQPGRLKTYIRDAVIGGHNDDGLLQRLQLLVWPDKQPRWEACSGEPHDMARDEFERVYREIDEMFRERWNEPTRFDNQAQEFYNDWLSHHNNRFIDTDPEAMPAFESHVNKYAGLMPSLAFLFSLLNGKTPRDPIEIYEAEQAEKWCLFLESHAAKVYKDELHSGDTAARELAIRIEKGFITDGMSVSVIGKSNWKNLKRPRDVAGAIDLLTELNWVRTETRKTGGRPSVVVRIHPDLRGGL